MASVAAALLAAPLLPAATPVQVAAGSQAAAPFTATALWNLKRLATPALAPDGRNAVIAVTSHDFARGRDVTHLWLVPTRTGRARQLTAGPVSDATPAFSPDGRWIAFVSQRGDDREPQVYVIAVDGGEARRVTDWPTGASAPRWFPDSKRIAFVSRVWPDTRDRPQVTGRLAAEEARRATGRTWDRAPVAHWNRLLDGREPHLFRVDLGGGEPEAITLGSGLALEGDEPGTGSYDIAPDGLEIAFVADSDGGRERNLDVFTVPADGGVATNLTADNDADDASPRYSPDGRSLAFGRQLVRGFYADRIRLMIFDRRSRQARELMPAWDRSATGITWAPDSRSLFGTVDDAGTQRIYRFDPGGDTPVALTAESSYGELAVAGSGPVIVALRSSLGEPPTLVSVIARSATATRLTDFNDTALAGLARGHAESITFAGAGAAPVQMWVVRPPGFTPDRRWPLLLLLHGGPHDSVQDAWQWRWNAQVFASWGYVVAWPNFHGSSGFGQAFADAAARDWADLPYQDVIRAAGWFAAQPWIDARRMAAAGGSYGGYLAAVLLGRDHPFAALVAHAPVYDLFGEYAMDLGARPRRFGDHWEDRERFERNSPHLAAGRFATPMLVTHGMLDLRVPPSQGLALFHTLQRRSVPSRLLLFPDEGHWIERPENSVQWYDTVRDWLATHVPPGAGPEGEAPR